MRKAVLLAALCAATLATGCSVQDRYAAGGAAIGGLGGAAIGAGLTGNPGGALIGGAIGAGAGTLVGAAVAPPEGGPYHAGPVYDPRVSYYPSSPYRKDDQCIYRDAYGQRYLALCPDAPRYGHGYSVY